MSHPYSYELENALRSLSRARMLLTDEIADYPTPISGCDAQFNPLLAERRRIGAALAFGRIPLAEADLDAARELLERATSDPVSLVRKADLREQALDASRKALLGACAPSAHADTLGAVYDAL